MANNYKGARKMQNILNLSKVIFIVLCLISTSVFAAAGRVPILCYHNFDPSKTGSMTVSTRKFQEQLQYLQDHDIKVISLQELVDYLHGKGSIPDKAVVITADDGRDTVYKYMLPIVRKYDVPVTLFIYPSSISNASYAMTWSQLRELQDTGLFDIQGHTYWHPNFKQEKKRLSEKAYDEFVSRQLVTSKNIIEKKLDTKVTLLAWPHGIFDQYLDNAAENSGYVMAFSIEGKPATKAIDGFTQPRYMILESTSMKTFANIVNGTK